MATWLPIRKYNRTQSVRIGSGADAQRVRATIKSGDSDATSTSRGWLAPPTYINIEDANIRKQFTYHSAIGAVYVVGPETSVDAGTTLSPGGRVDVVTLNGGSTATAAVISVGPLAVLGTSGVPVYSTGTNPATVDVAKPASGTWSGTNVADVLVQINNTTGAVTTKTSAAAASGSQVTPSVDSGNTAIAKFTLTYGATNHTASAVTNLKPY